MSTLLKPIWVQQQLLTHNLRIFTPLTFSRFFHLTPSATKYFLKTQTKLGLFSRLKKGLYMLATHRPTLEQISNALYSPSYLSLEYALSYYQLIPETIYSITAITSKPTRKFVVDNIAFDYHTIKKSAFTGYSLVEQNQQTHLIAEPEKALVDYLYFIIIHHKLLNDRLDLTRHPLDHLKILHYTSIFSLPALTTLTNNILQNKGNYALTRQS